MRTLLSLSQIGVVAYCADECRRQQSGEMSVWWMINAYQHLAEFRGEESEGCKPQLTIALVEELYSLVEPRVNKGGFRLTNVVVGGKVIGWQHIRQQLSNLLAAQDDLTAVEFYREFEEIHAGADGNGRVGSLLFNYRQDTLAAPVAPPDVFAVQIAAGEKGGGHV
ncbi:MAG: Fic family protein [Candidatus Obscuribacterales bacterium]|jgi:hypothetical protein